MGMVRGVVRFLGHYRAYGRGTVASKEEGKVGEATMGRGKVCGGLYERSLVFSSYCVLHRGAW